MNDVMQIKQLGESRLTFGLVKKYLDQVFGSYTLKQPLPSLINLYLHFLISLSLLSFFCLPISGLKCFEFHSLCGWIGLIQQVHGQGSGCHNEGGRPQWRWLLGFHIDGLPEKT